jgi:hypothetical protein
VTLLKEIAGDRPQARKPELRVHISLQDIKGKVVSPAEYPDHQCQEQRGLEGGRFRPKQPRRSQRDDDEENAFQPDQPGTPQIFHAHSILLTRCGCINPIAPGVGGPDRRSFQPISRGRSWQVTPRSDHFTRREHRCRSGPHRPDCGGSTPPSCRDRIASIAAMQRSLKPQSTGQHRGDLPFHAGVAQQRRQQFRKLPGNPPHGSASLPVGSISCSRNSNFQSGRLRTARLQVRALPGVPFCRVSPTTRGAPLRTERLGVELPHAAPCRPRSPMQRHRA